MSVSSTFDLFRTIQGAVEPAGSWQCEDRVLTPTSLRRKKERGEEAVVGVLAMRQTSPATSLRRKSPWRRRSRAASGGRHRGLRAPRSASMAWALRAKREPRTQFGLRRQGCMTQRFQSLDWEISVQIFLCTLESQIQRRPLSPSRSEVRGSRRLLAPPTLAKMRDDTTMGWGQRWRFK